MRKLHPPNYMETKGICIYIYAHHRGNPIVLVDSNPIFFGYPKDLHSILFVNSKNISGLHTSTRIFSSCTVYPCVSHGSQLVPTAPHRGGRRSDLRAIGPEAPSLEPGWTVRCQPTKSPSWLRKNGYVINNYPCDLWIWYIPHSGIYDGRMGRYNIWENILWSTNDYGIYI